MLSMVGALVMRSRRSVACSPTHGILKYANGANEADAFKIADAYCLQRGRVAQITQTYVIYDHIMFTCVEP